MRKKKIIVTLIALASIALAIVYTIMNMGQGNPASPQAKAGISRSSADSDSKEATAQRPAPDVDQRARGQRRPGPPPQDNSSERPRRKTQNTSSLQAKATTEDRSGNRQNSNSSNLAQVGVYDVTASSYKAVVKGYGEVQAVNTLTLVAQVSGQIEKIAPDFKTGSFVKAGQPLAIINKTTYLEALAGAKANYQAAQVALEEERLQGVQALDEWKRSGIEGEPASELVLRTPQLKAAQATLEEAKQAIETAKRNLTLTEITAPFDAIVVSRDISPGSYIQAGGSAGTLYSANTAEIAIGLSPNQWNQLPTPSLNSELDWPVTVFDAASNTSWQAKVSRIELHQDTTTRQRNAIVTVNQPLTQQTPLLFGTFVSAKIEGNDLNNVWKIPASSVSQKQEVWFVSPKDNSLQKFTPTVLFENDGFAFITPYQNQEQALIVSRPLNSYLVNTVVKPVIEATTGGAINE